MATDEEQSRFWIFLIQPFEGFDEFVDALVADETADEHKGEYSRFADFCSFCLNFGQFRIIMGKVDTAHIAVAEDL